jgi:hypothetical protein
LIWYSIKESRIKIEDMRNLFAQIKIPTDFLPEEPSKINAFKRATTELSEEVEVDLGQGMTAVYMIRLTAKSDDEIVKSLIKEVRDASNKKLSYEEIGRVHFDKDTEDVRYYDLKPDSQPIITQIKQMYETYCVYITGKQIRVMIHEIIKSMAPTLVRPSGAVYFIPYVHAEMVQKMEVLSKELAAYGITDYESAFESIPLIDADKTRALVEVRFEEQNTRDVDRTLVELAKLLQGTDTTTKTAAKYVEMVIVSVGGSSLDKTISAVLRSFSAFCFHSFTHFVLSGINELTLPCYGGSKRIGNVNLFVKFIFMINKNIKREIPVREKTTYCKTAFGFWAWHICNNQQVKVTIRSGCSF